MIKNYLFRAALVTASVIAAASPAWSDAAYPAKTIRIVVATSAGGAIDGTARLLAEYLRATWNQNVIVENKPGANAVIGSAFVAKAAPDGHTLLLATRSITTIKVFTEKPGFEPATDLTAIGQVAEVDVVLSATKLLPANDFASFVSFTRAQPDKVFHASGAGGIALLYELLVEKTGIKSTQVTYKGEIAALTAVAAGDAQVAISSISAARPLIMAGKIKPLAVLSTQRSVQAPNIPTTAESGVTGLIQASPWIGLLAPAGTPPRILRKIDAELAKFVSTPAAVAKLIDLGASPRYMAGPEFGSKIKNETDIWARLAARMGVKPE